MSDEIIILKNSSSPGKIPRTKDLQFGELAINTNSGTIFTRRTNRIIDEIVSFNSDSLSTSKLETVQNDGSIDLNVQFRQTKSIILDRHTRINFTNLPIDGTCITLVIALNNLGDFAVNWKNSIIWEDGQAPSIAANSWSIFEFLIMGDSKIFGILKATNMKEAQ